MPQRSNTKHTTTHPATKPKLTPTQIEWQGYQRLWDKMEREHPSHTSSQVATQGSNSSSDTAQTVGVFVLGTVVLVLVIWLFCYLHQEIDSWFTKQKSVRNNKQPAYQSVVSKRDNAPITLPATVATEEPVVLAAKKASEEVKPVSPATPVAPVAPFVPDAAMIWAKQTTDNAREFLGDRWDNPKVRQAYLEDISAKVSSEYRRELEKMMR